MTKPVTMKSFITTFLGILCISSVAFSQSMKQIAKNQVSESMVVYTYNLVDVEFEDSAVPTDANASKVGIASGAEFTVHFSGITGVSEAAFDATTKTITVYADPSALLPSVINLDKLAK